jgi:hypothetical protein
VNSESLPLTRGDIPSFVARVLGRPARWAPPESILAAYDGWERTLQVFNAESREQIGLLEQLEPNRPILDELAGGPIVVIFLSSAQSARHLPLTTNDT